MVCFEVTVNGKRRCRAGVEDGGLHAMLGWTNRRPKGLTKTGRRRRRLKDGYVFVGGSDGDDHVDWISHGALNVGDRISIKIVESDRVDAPISRREMEDPGIDRAEFRYLFYKAYKREFEKPGAKRPRRPNSEEAKKIRRQLYEEYRQEFESDET